MRWGRAYFALQAVAGSAWWVAVFAWQPVRTATLGGLDPLAVAIVDVPLFVAGSALAALGVKVAAWVATSWTFFVAVALAGYATFTAEAGWGVLAMAAAAGASAIALCLVVLGRVPTEWIIFGPFAFRQAMLRPTRTPYVAATGLQLVVFWGLFLLVIPLAVVFFEQRWAMSVAFPPGTAQAGFALLAVFSALGIWSAISMSTVGRGTPLPVAMANRLVVVGPYRYIRNPMATAGIVQGVAVGLVLSSWLVVVYAVLGSLLWNYAVRPQEERDLAARFGEEYLRYRDTVRCWVPMVTT